MKRNVAILIYDDAEVLDFAGPFEVFSVTAQLNNYEFFNVFTVAETLDPVRAINGLSVNPDYDYNNCPKVDILIISGGNGSRKQIENQATLNWVMQVHEHTAFTLSICSGSRILGVLGLLDGQAYCTHHLVYEHMEQLVPTGIPKREERFVQAGKIFTSGGISAGIDLSFHLIESLHGNAIIEKTAKYMEYRLMDA